MLQTYTQQLDKMMGLWALENADDNTIVMFGCLIIVSFIVMCGVALIDWIKNRNNGKS